MKIALLSDVHLLHKKPEKRIDNILEEQWNKLEFVFKYCQKNSMSLLQAGDLFDKSRDWNTLDRFISLKQKYSFEMYSIYGQHDMYQRNTGIVCNMSLLESLGFVRILDKKGIYDGIWIYGCSFGEKSDKNKPGILVIHAPITCKELYLGMEYTQASSFLKTYKDYNLILCGDIHVPFIIQKNKRFIVNTGCMVRKTINDDFDPRFYVYDTEIKTLEIVFIPCKPFVEIFREQLDVDTKQILEEFIKEITDYESKGTDILKNIHSFIEKNNLSDDVKQVIYQIMTEGDVE